MRGRLNALIVFTIFGVLLLMTKLEVPELKYESIDDFHEKFVPVLDDLFVYSAYFDKRPGSPAAVRMVAVGNPLKNWTDLACVFLNQERNRFAKSVPAKTVKSVDSFNNYLKSGLIFIVCEIDPIDMFQLPAFVHLVNQTTAEEEVEYLASILIRIPPPSVQNTYKYPVAICVQPLHSLYERPVELLEWIEYYRMMGVSHFTFYNCSISPITNRVLESYGKNLVAILDFRLPSTIAQGIGNYGQLAAAADCSYRHIGQARYLMAFDTDEFLIPGERTDSFPEYFDRLWNAIEMQDGISLSSIRFKSKLSFTSWEKDFSAFALPENEGLSPIFERMMIPWRTKFLPAMQTKIVMRPERVVESGVHYIGLMMHGTKDVTVERTVGYYMHFRNCIPYFMAPNGVLENNATCNGTKAETILDVRNAYGYELLSRMRQKVQPPI